MLPTLHPPLRLSTSDWLRVPPRPLSYLPYPDTSLRSPFSHSPTSLLSYLPAPDQVEHRALTPAPYWKIPGANELIPRLKEFNTDMNLLNDVLYRLGSGLG